MVHPICYNRHEGCFLKILNYLCCSHLGNQQIQNYGNIFSNHSLAKGEVTIGSVGQNF